ncbi:MAG TPA: metallophosphoesterase family protein [Terriglobales bacterium]|nr:metallophosphoesterase family protein [Terriglobales bacterium]
MRILLLSDIHSNLEALEACLAAAPAYDLIVNLGDIVGYGASPNEVVARARELGTQFVRGNHDKAAVGLLELRDFNPVAGLAALWTREQLSQENADWLRALPSGPLKVQGLANVQFVHGSPHDEDEYVVTEEDAILTLQDVAVPLTFLGHTHLQGGFSADSSFRPQYATIGQLETCELKLEDTAYLINPGSVGQPRDGDWRAGFALYDSEAHMITFYRVPYDVRKAQERIVAANLPQRLASRLTAGK